MAATNYSSNGSGSFISAGANEKGPQTAALSKNMYLSDDFDPKHMNLVVQESILLGGGAAAILLQVAEAGVGQGVNQHSNFSYRVVDRLRTTMTFVYCMSFGTPQERRTISDMVTRVHNQVNGVLDEGRDKGKPYSANDVDLQVWVAATLYATAIELYERIWGKIKDEELADKIYSEYGILACSLQCPPEAWPPSRRAFWEYWDRKVASIEVTEHAKAVARDLLYLPHAPFYLRIFMPSVRCVTAEWMPAKIRDDFGISYHPKMYKLHELMVKAMYKPMPLKLRSLPVRMYMKDMRKRLAAHQKVFEKA